MTREYAEILADIIAKVTPIVICPDPSILNMFLGPHLPLSWNFWYYLLWVLKRDLVANISGSVKRTHSGFEIQKSKTGVPVGPKSNMWMCPPPKNFEKKSRIGKPNFPLNRGI